MHYTKKITEETSIIVVGVGYLGLKTVSNSEPRPTELKCRVFFLALFLIDAQERVLFTLWTRKFPFFNF